MFSWFSFFWRGGASPSFGSLDLALAVFLCFSGFQVLFPLGIDERVHRRSHPKVTEKQHERMRTDDRCSGVYFVSRKSQSCASQVLSVSRCKKEVCNMHAHAPRKGTGAYGHCCPSPLQDAPSVYPTPCGHRQRDWALPQAHARSSYQEQRNLSPPRTEVAPSLSPNTQYWETWRFCTNGWLVIHLSCALAMPRCFTTFLKRTSSSEHVARLSLAFSSWKFSAGNSKPTFLE